MHACMQQQWKWQNLIGSIEKEQNDAVNKKRNRRRRRRRRGRKNLRNGKMWRRQDTLHGEWMDGWMDGLCLPFQQFQEKSVPPIGPYFLSLLAHFRFRSYCCPLKDVEKTLQRCTLSQGRSPLYIGTTINRQHYCRAYIQLSLLLCIKSPPG